MSKKCHGHASLIVSTGPWPSGWWFQIYCRGEFKVDSGKPYKTKVAAISAAKRTAERLGLDVTWHGAGDE